MHAPKFTASCKKIINEELPKQFPLGASLLTVSNAHMMEKICETRKSKVALSVMKDGVGSGKVNIDMQDPSVVAYLHWLADQGAGESRCYRGVWFEFMADFSR